MALAPLAHVLYSRVMKHDPTDSLWPDRDRFILSAGHASILQYSMLFLQGYGLEELGIPTHRKHFTIDTNEYLQTIYPNIFAAGDVVGPFQFTHVAAHQAWYAVVNALFGSFKNATECGFLLTACADD